MASRVSPAERLRVEIDQVFAGSGDLAGAVEQVARLGAQLLLQAALEAEVSEFLGRERYARQADSDLAREGMRNGYCPTTIKTTAGPVTLERPKLRGTTERFASQLFGTGVLRTNALEALVIASFVRGLSVRDVEATLTEALGEQASVSKSAVSRVCAQLKEQFETWSRRRLDDVTLDYLFLDASHFKYHPNAGAEPVLAAWGIDTDGKPVFVGLDTAATESGDAWGGFLTDLGERGLSCPLLVISDGAPGLIAAAEQTMSAALRQRCLIHRTRKEISWLFWCGRWMIWYANQRGDPRTTGYSVRGVAAASERASAAVGAGHGGAATGTWRGSGCRAGGRGECNDGAARGRRARRYRRLPGVGEVAAGRWGPEVGGGTGPDDGDVVVVVGGAG